MTQTPEIFLIGCGENQPEVIAENAVQYFMELSEVELINPIVIAEAETDAMEIADTVASALKDIAPVKIIKSTRLHDASQTGSDISVECLLDEDSRDTGEIQTVIAIANSGLVWKMLGQPCEELFVEQKHLDDVVHFDPEEINADGRLVVPEAALSISIECDLEPVAETPIRCSSDKVFVDEAVNHEVSTDEYEWLYDRSSIPVAPQQMSKLPTPAQMPASPEQTATASVREQELQLV